MDIFDMDDDDDEEEEEEKLVLAAVAMAKVTLSAVGLLLLMKKRKSSTYPGRIPGCVTISRKRRNLNILFSELTSIQFRRMYRMHKESFNELVDILAPKLPQQQPRKRGKDVNGPITNETRLAMALRWFAGGSKYDIACNHGVGVGEVYKSVWMVVDAIHATSSLDISFPSNHDEQQSMADQFKAKSGCGFGNCVAAVDGMLVWTSKPTEQTDDMGIGASKFFCGRKMKFGLNIQAVCGPDKRFLDVTCCHPGSASDFTMWLDCPLREKVETAGFLKAGLQIYGDNAYVNTMYMVSPFRQVSEGPKDAYNFYQSQLRITIEGALGMLVHKWGCLRKPLPPNIAVSKLCRLVLALCKLHNYCIGQREITDNICSEDRLNVLLQGGFAMDDSNRRVNELLDGGVPDSNDKEFRTATLMSMRKQDLPIFSMLKYIEDNDYTRPKPT